MHIKGKDPRGESRKMRFGLIGLGAVVSSILVANVANAADAGDNFSRGQGPLKWESRKQIPGPTSEKIGGSTLAVTVGADLDPMKDLTKPLLLVDMTDKVTLEAS